jgi:hypothetical protein
VPRVHAGNRRERSSLFRFADKELYPAFQFIDGHPASAIAGSDRGADRAAFMATLIMTAKLNDIDPQAWLADVRARIADTPITTLEDLLPWNWSPLTIAAAKAA